MAKTNFTKVEEALKEGMHKISVENLLEVTNQKAPKSNEEIKQLIQIKERHLFALALEQHLKHNYKRFPHIYTELKVKKKHLKDLVGDPSLITDDEWDNLQKLKVALLEYKKIHAVPDAEVSDENLIESSRKKHINKRFNINDKWLPLK